jgi:hypothetical protein
MESGAVDLRIVAQKVIESGHNGEDAQIVKPQTQARILSSRLSSTAQVT